MSDRILVDTNVLIDYLLTREPFYEDAKGIVSACVDGKVKGCIAAHSISNMCFILRKDHNAKERREVLANLCSIFMWKGLINPNCFQGFKMKSFQILRIAYRWNVQSHMGLSIL